MPVKLSSPDLVYRHCRHVPSKLSSPDLVYRHCRHVPSKLSSPDLVYRHCRHVPSKLSSPDLVYRHCRHVPSPSPSILFIYLFIIYLVVICKFGFLVFIVKSTSPGKTALPSHFKMYKVACMYFSAVNGSGPAYLSEMLHVHKTLDTAQPCHLLQPN